jgi:hypothetical protein
MKTSTGNLIADTAAEVESLTKAKALSMVAGLADNIDSNCFKLGGVLKVIKDNNWWADKSVGKFKSFDSYVFERFGFHSSKAYYLMSLYTNLVTKQIPWSKVEFLGWAKLRLIASIITLENLDEWVAKASSLTYTELCEVVKAKPADHTGVKTTDEMETIKFKLHKDQAETVRHALAKIKGEMQTDTDTVALENMAALILGGKSGPAVITPEQLKAAIAKEGYEATLIAFGEVYPEIDVAVTLPDVDPAAQASA